MALTLPVYPSGAANQNYTNTANYLAQSARAISDEAVAFLTQLGNLKAIEFSQVGNLPELDSIVWAGSTYGLGDRPVRPNIEIANFASLLAKLEALTPPAAPSTEFNYTDPGYASILRDPFISKLLYDMQNGGYGIETDDELNLWNRARDREALATQTNIDDARRQAAYSGFPLPQGSLNTAILRARQEGLAKMSSVNRDIALKRADMYVQNRQFILDKVLASENQSIELYNAVQNRALQVARTQVELAISLFDSGIKYFVAQQEALLKQIEAGVENARLITTIYASDVQAYSAFVNATVSAAQVNIANSRNVLQRDIAEHQSRADIIRFQLQQLGLTLSKNVDINKFGTEFYRTALGSTMNGINGLAVQTSEVS